MICIKLHRKIFLRLKPGLVRFFRSHFPGLKLPCRSFFMSPNPAHYGCSVYSAAWRTVSLQYVSCNISLANFVQEFCIYTLYFLFNFNFYSVKCETAVRMTSLRYSVLIGWSMSRVIMTTCCDWLLWTQYVFYASATVLGVINRQKKSQVAILDLIQPKMAPSIRRPHD